MLSAARAAWVIAAKDLLQRRRDRSVYLVGLVAPLVLALVLNLTFGAEATSSPGVRVAVVDADGGELGARFQSLARTLEGQGVLRVEVTSLAEGMRALDDDRVSAVIEVPEGTTERAAQGAPIELVVTGHPERLIGTRVAASVARGFVAEVDAVRLATATVATVHGTPPDAELTAQVIERFGTLDRPVAMADDAVAGRGFDLTTYYAIGIAVFFLFFTVQFGVLGIMDERGDGTLARLLASPIDPRSVLFGKLGGSFVVGLISMALLVVSTTWLLGARWGALAPVVLFVVLGVVSAVALTALVATLARTPEQAGSWSTFVAVGLGTLGGAFFPLSFAPAGLTLLSRLTPHRWLLEGFRDASFGAGVADVLDAALALVVFIVVVGGLAALRAGRLVRLR